MQIYKVKCADCDKVIKGVSEKEVNAWLGQHNHYIHSKVLGKGVRAVLSKKPNVL